VQVPELTTVSELTTALDTMNLEDFYMKQHAVVHVSKLL